jgi:hypothetical protein
MDCFVLPRTKFFAAFGLVVAAALSLAPSASAQTCEPFETTLEMTLFPHPAFQLPVFARAESPGCVGHPAASCTVQIDLDPSIPDNAALARKCTLLAAALSTQCGPRFVVSNVQCAAGFSTFKVADSLCVGQPPLQPDDGIIYAMANSSQALSSFVSGTVLPDYERDTVVPGCAGTANGSSVVGVFGTATGSPTTGQGVPGSVELTVGRGDQLRSVSVPTSAGMTPTQVMARLITAANDQFRPQGVQFKAVGPAQQFLTSVQHPFALGAFALNSNDTGVGHTNVAGAAGPMADVVAAISSNSCPDLRSPNCRLIAPAGVTPTVPMVGRWGVMGLALGIAGLGIAGLRRRRSA